MKKFLAIIIGGFLILSTSISLAQVVKACSEKVTICHATSSVTNPYTKITVSENAIGGHFDNPGTPKAGHEKDILLEGDVACPTAPEQIEPLKLTSMCSNDPDLSRRWRVRNTNPWDIDFTWEVYLNIQTESGTAIGNSDTFFETDTIAGPNTVKIYWQDNGETKSTVKASGGKICTEPTPTPTPSPSGGGGTTTNIKKPKISPQVLGTQAPVEEEALPVSGADINYDWVYYFLIIGSLLMTYYLKVRGWKKIRA